MEQKAVELASRENSERTIAMLNTVFRRLLANLLLDFESPKFRKVRTTNNAINRNTAGLSPEFVALFFDALGFGGQPDSDGFVHFDGSRDTLKAADTVYTAVENAINDPKNNEAAQLLAAVAQDKKNNSDTRQGHSTATTTTMTATAQPTTTTASQCKQEKVSASKDGRSTDVFYEKDFTSVEALRPIATKTLLNAGRVRNSFFDAKGMTLRRMRHGRVYACTEMCSDDCIEVHWHLYSGKGMLYSYVAHLSPDATELIHLGAEHGYQYNSMPGSEFFGKTVHFTEKLVSADGRLLSNKHPNKPAESCIYCGETFYKLFM